MPTIISSEWLSQASSLAVLLDCLVEVRVGPIRVLHLRSVARRCTPSGTAGLTLRLLVGESARVPYNVAG